MCASIGDDIIRPPRYHAFDLLYQILLTELSVEADTLGRGGGGGCAMVDELKGGLQGFLREAVVCR
jgi:hypothetical protein